MSQSSVNVAGGSTARNFVDHGGTDSLNRGGGKVSLETMLQFVVGQLLGGFGQGSHGVLLNATHEANSTNKVPGPTAVVVSTFLSPKATVRHYTPILTPSPLPAALADTVKRWGIYPPCPPTIVTPLTHRVGDVVTPCVPLGASLPTDICPRRKECSSMSHARNPFNLYSFDSAQCLMVRRWRLIDYSPILYNPPSSSPLTCVCVGRVHRTTARNSPCP
jgi:hypothetical protein